MFSKIVPVILAGGQGTRLWPISRNAYPKQFMRSLFERSLFQDTLQRVVDDRYLGPLVVTNEEYRFLAAEQMSEEGHPASGLILEPAARNTCAAIAAAALFAVEKLDSDSILHVLPSDHAIDSDSEYWDAVDAARLEALEDRLVTFGIKARSADTGYGYIEKGDPRSNRCSSVRRFIEKPDKTRAEEMIRSGNFLWNSGMFMFKASVFLAELSRLQPQVKEAVQAAVEHGGADHDFFRLSREHFEQSPSVSIDYGVLEHTDLVSVIPSAFTWSDLGSWDAFWQMRQKDEAENVVLGNGLLSETRRSLIFSEKAHIAVHGLEDVAVIASEDAIFVGRLSDAQSVGRLVASMKSNPATAYLTEIHRTSYRPWGGYSSIARGERFQVKRLFVKPGRKLSLQKHFHRAEHWVVVSGTAEVTINGEVKTLTENQSVYLPLGCVHRLANPGKILLELIEVQTGAYLEEDDIIRIEDEFGRLGRT